MEELQLLSMHTCFGGSQRFYSHHSNEIGLSMRFSVYLPPQALVGEHCAAIMYLAGLTCNEETFMIKAGAQKYAAREGIILVAPDTSPRGAGITGENDAWDIGVAASFYVDATQTPWHQHYRMQSYLIKDLLPCLVHYFSLDVARIGIMGHSMGGHGALTLALRYPEWFHSVSAFAPIAASIKSPWGRKAFITYLGEDESHWQQADASVLMLAQKHAPFPQGILIDQGLDDKFLIEQLHPNVFAAACTQVKQPLHLRQHAGYDHGYYFISSFIEDHLLHHKKQLG
jgi:S-formylglutathione hydrolase